jgi:hypothetical protein
MLHPGVRNLIISAVALVFVMMITGVALANG